MKTAEIHTKKGVMKIKFFEKDAPNTVKNFITLAEKGFYNGLSFHRVIPNFVIQGGCPNGIGNGGPGYTIDCELTGDNQYHDRGVLSMAHAGRNTGGSQFFICHSRNSTSHLDRNHTVFGKVVEGLDVIDQIRQGDVMEKVVIRDEEISKAPATSTTGYRFNSASRRLLMKVRSCSGRFSERFFDSAFARAVDSVSSTMNPCSATLRRLS